MVNHHFHRMLPGTDRIEERKEGREKSDETNLFFFLKKNQDDKILFITSMVPNLDSPDGIGLQLPEAFTTTCASQEFWEL